MAEYNRHRDDGKTVRIGNWVAELQLQESMNGVPKNLNCPTAYLSAFDNQEAVYESTTRSMHANPSDRNTGRSVHVVNKKTVPFEPVLPKPKNGHASSIVFDDGEDKFMSTKQMEEAAIRELTPAPENDTNDNVDLDEPISFYTEKQHHIFHSKVGGKARFAKCTDFSAPTELYGKGAVHIE
ncbi:hypothetical protein J8273_5819 [Carpediemonas membranifera]|uniref:Uncharacterized protein n=1 Tax=Carpediemonas membranifera TaxID=201153 RepID=A0A8J6B9J2_9EUKA|nr:hypothetical protein J8273_5819 [Carpediemonas membranifera]|eukprot:KAG9392787.1 hypothetical protein J8273_5819 [Carpediemonas membranifera]